MWILPTRVLIKCIEFGYLISVTILLGELLDAVTTEPQLVCNVMCDILVGFATLEDPGKLVSPDLSWSSPK